MKFELQKGEKATYTLLENGSYLITVPDKTATIELNFKFSEDGQLVITDMDASKEIDGPSISPPTGGEFDMTMTVAVAFVSAGAILLLLFVCKRRKKQQNKNKNKKRNVRLRFEHFAFIFIRITLLFSICMLTYN